MSAKEPIKDSLGRNEKSQRLFGQQNVNLKCKQDDDQYLYMYWYRQISNGSMELVAYSLGKDISTIEAPFKDTKYSMSRPSTGSFTVKNLKPEDKGLYFCAVSKHSDETTRERRTKTSQHFSPQLEPHTVSETHSRIRRFTSPVMS
uniref:Ig-like domain-containing protein n=1 Tax=Poecilia mexicana TaxID=48701 RepID=A0A3B3WQA0_9TELE